MSEAIKHDRAKIRDRLSEIRTEIQDQRDFIEFAACRDPHFAMARARIESLKHERARLKEILGDL